MAFIKTDISGAVRSLGRMELNLRDPRRALKRVGQYIKGLSQQSFRNQADPETHRPWKSLSPATIARRRGKSTQILVDTGRLRKSIHSLITGKTSVAVGTNVMYGRYHQFGTKHAPKRPFLGIDKAGQAEIVKIIKRGMLDGV